MTSSEFQPGEYANLQGEVVENLIVKAGKSIPLDIKIPGQVIQSWKIDTVQYFKLSPDFYLIENEFFNELSENMKVDLVKLNLCVVDKDKGKELEKRPL